MLVKFRENCLLVAAESPPISAIDLFVKLGKTGMYLFTNLSKTIAKRNLCKSLSERDENVKTSVSFILLCTSSIVGFNGMPDESNNLATDENRTARFSNMATSARS